MARTLVAVVVGGALAVAGLVALATRTTPVPDRSGSAEAGRSSNAPGLPYTGAAQPSPPYPVVTSSVAIVDASRSTPERGSVPATPSRVLTTKVWRPVGPSGPLPTIVFAHGWNSSPDQYAPLLQAWAAAGYLVTAPVFPDSSSDLPGTPVNDFPDQARDLTFVLTSLLDRRVLPIDPSRLAVAGHSDGGTDVALLALNPAYADPRIRAFLSLSSEIPDGVAGPWGTPVLGTLLVAVGTDDEYGLLPRASQVYQTASMVKVLLTITGGDHLGPFVGASPQAQSVRGETVRFLQLALGAKSVTPSALGAALIPIADPTISVATASG